MTLDSDAAQRLQTFAGLSGPEAQDLVQAIREAAAKEALAVLAGNESAPPSIADARALRLMNICEAAQRTLRPREVEVVFRLPPSSAAAVDRRMRALYPEAVETFMRELVRSTSTVTKTGDAKAGLRYDVYFDEPAAVDYAYQILQRENLTRDVRVRRSDQRLDLPREMTDRHGEKRDPLRVLGIDGPSPS